MAKLNEPKFTKIESSPSGNTPKVDSPQKVDPVPKDKIDRQVKSVRATRHPLQTPQGVSIGSKSVELPITSWIQCQIEAGLVEVVED